MITKGGFIKIDIEGLPEVKRLFDSIPKKVGEAATIRGLKWAARPMKKAAKDKVTKKGTGNLKKSIGIKVMRKSRYPTIIIAPLASKYGGVVRYDGWYGHFVEFGTVTEFGKKGQSAQPYMRPAFDETVGEVNKRLKDYFTGLVKEYGR